MPEYSSKEIIHMTQQENFQAQHINKNEWEECLPSEVAFWDNYLKTKGDEWKDDFAMRLNPHASLQNIFVNYLDQTITKNLILDVGAGPITFINKKSDPSQVEIIAVDPLAELYDELLRKHNIVPLVRTQKCDGEKLTAKFSEDTFDIVHSRNALDHSYDPVKCIEEMIKVAKKGRFVILQVFEKEGSFEKWHGLHQWNFFIAKKSFFGKNQLYLQGRNTPKINLTEVFMNRAHIFQLTKNKREIVVVFKKI